MVSQRTMQLPVSVKLSMAEVTDNAGRSGRSYNEFVDYMVALPWHERPRWLLIECVSNLHHHRTRLEETSTQIVSKQLGDFGYRGSWKEARLLSLAICLLTVIIKSYFVTIIYYF